MKWSGFSASSCLAYSPLRPAKRAEKVAHRVGFSLIRYKAVRQRSFEQRFIEVVIGLLQAAVFHRGDGVSFCSYGSISCTEANSRLMYLAVVVLRLFAAWRRGACVAWFLLPLLLNLNLGGCCEGPHIVPAFLFGAVVGRDRDLAANDQPVRGQVFERAARGGCWQAERLRDDGRLGRARVGLEELVGLAPDRRDAVQRDGPTTFIAIVRSTPSVSRPASNVIKVMPMRPAPSAP